MFVVAVFVVCGHCCFAATVADEVFEVDVVVVVVVIIVGGVTVVVVGAIVTTELLSMPVEAERGELAGCRDLSEVCSLDCLFRRTDGGSRLWKANGVNIGRL